MVKKNQTNKKQWHGDLCACIGRGSVALPGKRKKNRLKHKRNKENIYIINNTITLTHWLWTI